MILSVTDVQDPRIAPFRFVRERDLVGRDGAFMAEGEVVLRQLLRQLGHGETDARPGLGHRLSALLLSEVQARRLADLITGLPDEVPVYVASQAIMDKVTGFPIHRGILALGVACPMPEAAALLDSLPARALVVGAVGLTNHDNMGGIFRNAAAFGAGAVLLDGASCDPLYRKAIRVSVGASLSVPFARVPNTLDMVDLLESRGFQVIALSPAGRERLSSLTRPPKVAALFGTEGPGLPADVLARVRTVSIPMAGDFDSLNVATTCGIVLHHLAQD